MSDLFSLLKEIQLFSQQLASCLEQEKLALDNNLYEKLSELATQKQTLVDKLQRLDQQRIACCPGPGNNNNMNNNKNNNFNSFISNSQNPSLIAQWDSCRDIIRQCQQQNEINGRLLNKRNRINQETIAILTGRSKQADLTYNAQGNQGNSSSLLNDITA